MSKKRIRTDAEQAFIDMCEVAFDYHLAYELTDDEIRLYDELCEQTVMKPIVPIKRKEKTLTKEQAILYLRKVLSTWNTWKTHHKYLALAIETLLKEVK